jgi:hypothetical protein
MEFKDVERIMYQDEEFLKYLPLLQPEYWKKAKPNKRLKIFKELQRIINSVEPRFSPNVEIIEFSDDELSNVLVAEKAILVNEALFRNTCNPYDIITNYIFELEIINNFTKATENEEFASTEKGRKIAINSQASIIGEWENYWPRTHKEFFYQPVTWESAKVAKAFTYNLMKYMHKNYYLDEFIASKLAGLMISSFNDEKSEEKVLENFKLMEEKAALYDGEKATIEAYYSEMSEMDLLTISDEVFFGFFNRRIMNATNDETVWYLIHCFIARELKGYSELESVLEGFDFGYDEQYGKCLCLDGKAIFVRNYQEAFENVVIFVSNVKLKEGLCTEINDKKLLEDAKQCYEYLIELQDESGAVEVEYLDTALNYYDYRNLMLGYYYNKIKEAIPHSKYYKEGIPFLPEGDFSKYDAYLSFAWDKTFEEVKQLQQASLKRRCDEKKGGRR